MEFNENELKGVVRKMIEAKQAYYGPSGKPIMTDQEYDAMEEFVRGVCPDHPVLAKVGSEPSSSWEKVTHDMPMGSLTKVHSEEEFRKWASKFPPDTLFVAQPKLDGLSLELKYDGELKQAVVRGDGVIGENILPNALKMKRMVKDLLVRKISIRAEVLLPKVDFERINDTILNEDDKYSNERNAAAGISRRLDGAYCEYLTVMAYDIVDHSSEFSQPDEVNKPRILSNLGMTVPPIYSGGVDAMVVVFTKIKTQREAYQYGLDGVVIKVSSSKIQKESGSIGGKPRAQIAWKFDPPGAAATLESISWEVGRTGVVTPLGHVKPVEIDGSIISNVTLHNIAQISRLNVGISDTVMLVKAGDIIPFIESVLEHKGQPIEIPTHCPSCGEPLENNDIQLFCRNIGCPAKNFYRIMNWIKVTEIENFGESLLDKLFGTSGWDDKEWLPKGLREIADIYKLTPQDIAGIEGWGEHSAGLIIDNINNTRVMEPERFLTAVGIPGISNKTAEDLIKRFGSMEAVLKAKEPDIIEMNGYSDISAKAIIEGLKGFQEEILSLMEIIKFEKQETGGKLVGQTFCFTGAMARPRSEYQDMVKAAGGKNLSTVTKELTYLVCNENKGSSKSVKAEKFGVKIITEQEFLAMIGDTPGTPDPAETAVIENVPLFD